MAAAGKRQASLITPSAKERAGHRAEILVVGRLPQERLIDRGENPRRLALPGGNRPQSVADETRGDGGLWTPPTHIADHQGPGAIAHVEHVVEVAANLASLTGGDVARRQFCSRNVGQRWWQQAGLQDAGDVCLLGVQTGVVQGQGRPPGQLGGQGQIPVAEAATLVARDHREGP
jgi:hypothetical protein